MKTARLAETACLIALVVVSIIMLIDIRAVRSFNKDIMQGSQTITHSEIPTSSGPVDVTTERQAGESVTRWLERHAEAIEAAQEE